MNIKIISQILIPLFILIFLGVTQLTNGQTPTSESSVGFITMEINSTPKTGPHYETDVNVTKSLTTADSELIFRYKIETPPVNDFDFVLALDSSGSLAASEGMSQVEAINVAVPNFINDTLKKYQNIKNFNLSIISWNDNVDFVYNRPSTSSPNVSGFGKADPRNAFPGSLEDVSRDLARNSPQVFGWPEDKNGLFKCIPTAHTNLSTAIQASMDILNNSENDDRAYKRPVKFIILVTGESEYNPCSEVLIDAAKTKGYSIYAIEMQPRVLDNSVCMFQHLRHITGDSNETSQEDVKTLSCQSPPEDLPMYLEAELKRALQKAISEPVATDVVIRDSFYDYIVPTGAASVQIWKKSGSYRDISTLTDNGTMYLSLPYGLPENNTTEVTASCNFILRDLPISAGNNSDPVVIASKGKNVSSGIYYTWLKIYPFDKPLPEVDMDLRSVSPPKVEKNEAPAEPEDSSAKPLGVESGLITLLSFMTILKISRNRW